MSFHSFFRYRILSADSLRTPGYYLTIEMKNIVLALVILLHLPAAGQQKIVGGKVVYIVPGSIYTSLGSNVSITDSAKIAVLRKDDTIAILQVVAVSSKSSVCKIIDSIRAIQIGDSAVAFVPAPRFQIPSVQQAPDSARLARQSTEVSHRASGSPNTLKPLARFSGQIGLQYNSIQSPNSAYGLEQSGMLISLRGESAILPLKLDLYGIFRSTGLGGAAPLSGTARNDSRFYRATLTYDDHVNSVSLGRMLPAYISSVGYIDGVNVAHRFGNITAGTAAGFQPSSSLQSLSADVKKFLVYALYENVGNWNTRAGAAYVDAWTSAGTERAAISTMLSIFSPNGLSLYGSADVDLRETSGGRSISHTSLTQLLCSAGYRFSDYITIGGGVDASRPIYDRAFTALLPDSLLDRRLKSGVSLNTNIVIVRGIWVFANYTSRFSEAGKSDGSIGSTSITIGDIVRSGVSLRANYLANENSVALTHGYGIALQRNMFGLDCGIRYQQNRSNILNLSLSAMSTSVGFDVAALIFAKLSVVGSYNLMRETDTRWNSLFVQLTWRF